MGSRGRDDWPTRVSSAQQAEEECDAKRNVAATVRRTTVFKGKIPRRYVNAHDFPGERALAGLCPERLPIKPPPARLQRLVRRGRRT